MSETTTSVPPCADGAAYPSRRARREAEALAAVRPPRPLRVRLVELRRTAVAGGVMLVAAGLAVGMTVPSNALMATASTQVVEVRDAPLAPAEPQHVELAAASGVAAAPVQPAARDSWSVGSVPATQMAAYQAAGLGYAPGYLPTSGAIRWPFPYSTTMSSGFGEIRGDSVHNGLDFNPGIGSPVQAIADGVVTWVGWKSNYGYGYFVTVQHVIGGVPVESLYGHMIDGSSPLTVGQAISVGDTIGLVGNTGYSTGPHLHLEIRIDGTPVDPYEWLAANATNR